MSADVCFHGRVAPTSTDTIQSSHRSDHEAGMAHWKRLTGTDGDQIDVNMDAVAYLQEFKDHTSIHFVAGLIAEGKAMIVGVKEKPDTIHLANPLHAA